MRNSFDIDKLKAIPIIEVAERLGIEVSPSDSHLHASTNEQFLTCITRSIVLEQCLPQVKQCAVPRFS